MIKSRAPLRIGLAGGGTDIKSYSDKFGGTVLNVTIQKYIYCTIEKNIDNKIKFISTDKGLIDECDLSSILDLQGELILHKAVYNHVINNYNNGNPIPITITTFSEIPSGSGLGSSSTLVVAMLSAFMKLLNLEITPQEIAQTAYYVERDYCNLDGGMQDQYSASFGGFNHIIFNKNGVVDVNRLNLSKETILELESRILLFYTGISRDSKDIISCQKNSIDKENDEIIKSMHELKNQVEVMKQALITNDLNKFSSSLNESWEHKKNTADKISNEYIEKILEQARNHGATSGKVSGAGGGGFILFLTPVDKRLDIIKSLDSFKGRFYDCQVCSNGVEAWEYN